MASHSTLSISHVNNVKLGAAEESEGNLEQAAKYYEESIKDERLDETPFNRLMIIYRKLKRYKDELRVIRQGIKRYEAFYKKQARSPKGKKLSQLSEAFMKTSGLKDRKGRTVYNPEPIATWMKRMEVVTKKIK